MRVPLLRAPLPASHVMAESPAPDNSTSTGTGTGTSEAVSVIRARLLIPGRGDPVRDGAVVVKAAKIAWAGAWSDRPSKYRDVEEQRVPVLMPGLWDCHCHYDGVDVAGGLDGASAALLPGASALIGAITVEDLERTLMAGYTTVRELGGHAGDVWPAVKIERVVGPNVYSSIAALSITGGHGDEHTLPLTTVMEAMDRGSAPVAVCDGVDDCIRTVRKMVRRGARVIKVCSSGGVLSLNDDPEDRQFSDEELRAIVDEAARSRRAVASHAIGKAGIMAALRAGVQSIEHGMYLDDEAAALMKDKDAIFVGTQHIQRVLLEEYRERLPPPSRRKLETVYAHSKAAYKTAIRAGVKIAFGTDMLSSDPASGLSHGNNAKEIAYAVELGMTPLQAIESATANGPETLGAMAPLSGQLKEGFDADLIVVSSNPLEDIGVLTDPANITHVWKAGKLYKSPS